ncbi:MAG: undecaprenyl-phosphate glucose phosphotransferase, partial [Chloroflexota bacterium]
MRSLFYVISVVFMVVIDILMTDLAALVAYHIRFTSGLIPFSVFHPLQAYFGLMLTQSLGVPLVLALRGMYRFRRQTSKIEEFQKVFTAVSIATIISLAATTFIARDFEYARVLLALGWALSVTFIWMGRLFQYWIRALLFRAGAGESRVLVVGAGELSRNIAEKIRQAPELGYRAAGFVADSLPASGESAPAIAHLGSVDDIGTIIRQHDVNEVIIAEPSLSHHQILDIVARCEKERVNIKIFPDVFQIISSEVSIGDLSGLPMLSIRDVALRGWNLTIKRAMDIGISFSARVVFSPLMLLAALLVKLTSREGPVFYVQERVGLDGKPFQLLKFRSMRMDAEESTGPVWAKAGDPRTTRVGALLRRFSLDELPQLVNVLVGEMSVVGPRPERPYFVKEFSRLIPRYLERHKEKAGITGWAQVNGLRGDVNIQERTAYDLWY